MFLGLRESATRRGWAGGLSTHSAREQEAATCHAASARPGAAPRLVFLPRGNWLRIYLRSGFGQKYLIKVWGTRSVAKVLGCEAMAVAFAPQALAKPITPKRERSHGSSAAVDRFLQDSRRRSCSFVNLSPTALQELTETARRHHLVLTSCEEQNVGTVARLEWPNRAVDAPAAVVADELVCPRCAIQQGKHATNWRDGRTVQLHLCAACSVPASPPSVISPASVMRQPSAHETPTLPGSSYESPHALLSALLPNGHPAEPPRTTLRVATGQAYDVYDVQPAAGARAGRSSPEPTAPRVLAGMLWAGSSSASLASPSPRRAASGMAGGMASSPPPRTDDSSSSSESCR